MNTSTAPIPEMTCPQPLIDPAQFLGRLAVSVPVTNIQPANSFLTPKIRSWLGGPFYEVPISVKKKQLEQLYSNAELTTNTDYTVAEVACQAISQYVPAVPVVYADAPVADAVSAVMMEESAPEAIAEFSAQPVAEYVQPAQAEYVAEPVAEYVQPAQAEYVAEPVAEYVQPAQAEYACEPVAEYVQPAQAEYVAEPVGEYVQPAQAEYASQPVAEYVAESVADFAPPPAADIESPAAMNFAPAAPAPLSEAIPVLPQVASGTLLPGFDISRLDGAAALVACDSEQGHILKVTHFLAFGGEGAQTFCKIFLNDLNLQSTVLMGLMNDPASTLANINFPHKELALRLAACSQARRVAQMLLADL